MVRLAHHEWFDWLTTSGLKGTPRNGEQAHHKWFKGLSQTGLSVLFCLKEVALFMWLMGQVYYKNRCNGG